MCVLYSLAGIKYLASMAETQPIAAA